MVMSFRVHIVLPQLFTDLVVADTILRKGSSIYDVRTEGGSPKEDVVREVA